MKPETVFELYNKLQDCKETLLALYDDEAILLNDIKHYNNKLNALQNHIETAKESKKIFEQVLIDMKILKEQKPTRTRTKK